MTSAPAPVRRHVVGIGDSALADAPGEVIVTHALGSCIAVCIWDPVIRVAGLLHFLLPDSRINPARAQEQPDTFADTGIPRLFQAAYARGLQKNRAVVCLVGGAEINGDGSGLLNVGRRNLLSARQLLWRNGVLIKNEAVGGSLPRTVTMLVESGRVQVMSGREHVVEL